MSGKKIKIWHKNTFCYHREERKTVTVIVAGAHGSGSSAWLGLLDAGRASTALRHGAAHRAALARRIDRLHSTAAARGAKSWVEISALVCVSPLRHCGPPPRAHVPDVWKCVKVSFVLWKGLNEDVENDGQKHILKKNPLGDDKSMC